jgi:soluble lytic murein transglycosylase
MHKQALSLTLLLASAAAAGAVATAGPAPLVKKLGLNQAPPAAQGPSQPTPAPMPPYQAPLPYSPPRPAYSPVSSALAQWNSLRQSDGHPFSSYASFLSRYPGWPGEQAMRKTAERAINPATSSPGEVVSFFRANPALTNTGHARHAFALLALGRVDEAREAARLAWRSGVLLRPDEDLLLGQFGGALSPRDHEIRLETLLDNRDAYSAQRTLGMVSSPRRALYEARIALQTKAPDAGSRVAMLGTTGDSDAGVLMDRAMWLRDTGQSLAARQLLAQRRTLASRPQNTEKWLETLLLMARGAAADRNWTTAYQIASQADEAFPSGTNIMEQSAGVRDEYTSLTWLAGTAALHHMGRPADAAQMFVRYARAGRSLQVATKGYYWAGRAATAAREPAQANSYFEQAARYPELFYGQLALERLGRDIPAPAMASAARPSEADRAAFRRSDMVEATRLLGQMGAWSDQSVFIRALAEKADDDAERVLATELAREIGRQDLNVWVARSARNAGTSFYVKASYPEANIPQPQYWSFANGIIRQESSFDRAAMSPVGARGMMQLMPPTAREVSGKLGMPYDLGRLTSDPSYNITLGTSYVGTLMDSWGGNAVLVAASYNAGSGNVRKWIREFGDPRLPGADVVKWIEDIPFLETRGYVQRVLENAVAYDLLNPQRARSPDRNRLSYYLGKSGRPG